MATNYSKLNLLGWSADGQPEDSALETPREAYWSFLAGHLGGDIIDLLAGGPVTVCA